MSIEAMKQALEALEVANSCVDGYYIPKGKTQLPEVESAITALRQAIEQAQKQEPEFTAHVVETAYDWSEWVCPDPKGYLMKCCDCGLVHEAEFKVVRYKSEAEREDCEPVNDPNVQAVFRMRRSEQWTPEDMAHRAGGLPIEQAQKQEPVAMQMDVIVVNLVREGINKHRARELAEHFIKHTSPPQRQPLTDEQWQIMADTLDCFITRGQKEIIEAALGIKE